MRITLLIFVLFLSLFASGQDLKKQVNDLNRDIMSLDITVYGLDNNHKVIKEKSESYQTYNGKDYVYTVSGDVRMLTVEGKNVIVNQKNKKVIVSNNEEIKLRLVKRNSLSLLDTIISSLSQYEDSYTYDGVINGLKQYSITTEDGVSVVIYFHENDGALSKIIYHEKVNESLGGLELRYKQIVPVSKEFTRLEYYIKHSARETFLTEKFKGYELIIPSN